MTEQQKYLSGELVHRLAAIDIGSNSIRLVVAEALRGGNYRTLDEERETTRLGRRLHSTESLDAEAIEASIHALRRFLQIAEGYQAQQVRTIATCAVREANNGDEFCHRVLEELGIDVEVISSQKEAQFAFVSVQRAFDLTAKNIALADIGGGSTEIVLASGTLIEAVYATDLGAVRMSEVYGGGQAMVGDDYDRMVRGIDRRLKQSVRKWDLWPHVLIGSGGTFTSLASMIRAQKGQDDSPISGYQVTYAELRHLLDRLRKMSPKARRSVTGLSPDRADIIVAGLTVVDRIMNRFKLNTLMVHGGGVRDGLLLSMIEQASPAESDTSGDRDRAIDRMAEVCRTEVEHGRQVARLAVQLFDQMQETAGLPVSDRVLLDAAARLQDVGYHINYTRHHKHSYHLILNSDLPGFSSGDLRIIANVARYHRGARPKKKHDNYRQLSREDRRRVKYLSALLRLAGGLDRSHSGLVHGVSVEVSEDDVELWVEAPKYPDVDLWGAKRRAGLFERVFKRSLNIEWAGPRNNRRNDSDSARSSSGDNGAGENGRPARTAAAKSGHDA